MIEESLLKSNFVGKDGFVWWIGQVAPASVWRNEKSKPDAGANTKDAGTPSWAYRCKVRIIGYHTFDGGILPDEDLPWAHVSVGAETGSAQGGVGQTMRLVGGETVYGFFIDGDDAQQPVIVGCLYRNESVQNLVDSSFLESEKSSQFKPFTGNQGKLIQGPTQIRRLNDAVQGTPTGNTEPINVSNSNMVGDPVSSTREENKSGNDQLIRYDLATQQWNTNGVGINTTSNVGIGTTNPTEKLTVGGNILLNQTTLYGSVQASTASTIATGIHSGLSTSVYRSVEYTIRASEGSNYQMVKILAIHNGTTAYDTQYGNIYNTEVASFDVDISGGNVRLVAIASSTSTTNYTVNFIATKI